MDQETFVLTQRIGDVVRIAPDSLAFFTHQAFKDIHAPNVKGLEVFSKASVGQSGGILFERDPVKHKQMQKQLLPAFSSRSITAMEPVLHHHIDSFVRHMKTKGNAASGVSINNWTHWLGMDIAIDMTYGQQAGHMDKGENLPGQ